MKQHGFRVTIITLINCALLFLISIIPFGLVSLIDPLDQALSDFDFNDLVFSKLRTEQPADTSIVLVNIGNLSRGGIASEIYKLNRFKPKVIGLDAFFYKNKSAHGDSLLEGAFSSAQNLVLVNRLTGYRDDADVYDTVMTSLNRFNRHVENGYANLPDEGSSSFRTIRRFVPFATGAGNTVPAFSSEIVKLYDSTKYNTLKSRRNDYEAVNFRGNSNKFYALDVNDVLDSNADLSFIKGKIVLMGFMGPDFDTKDLDDMFFTPMNSKYAGKSFPDMYGIVIHANIISMILNESYITRTPAFLKYLLVVLVSLLNVIVLLQLKKRFAFWSSAVTKVWLLVQSIFFLFITVYAFEKYLFKIDLTAAALGIFLTTTSIELYEIFLEKILHQQMQSRDTQ